MSDNEDIRRALADLAGNPAPRDLKPGVHQRVAKLHRRRQGTTAAALSVVTLAAGLTLTRLPALHHQAPNAHSLSTTSPDASSESSESQTTKPPKSASQSSKPPVAVGVPQAPSRGTTPTRTQGNPTGAGHASTSAATPGTTVSAPSSGAAKTRKPSTAAGTKPSSTPSGSAGPDLSKEALATDLSAVTDVDGSAAPFTTLTVHVSGKIYGSLDDVEISYRPSGGRSSMHRDTKVAGPCVPQSGLLHDVDQSLTFRYRFRLATGYTPSVTIRTWDLNCTTGVARREWKVTPRVDVSAASSLSNGPEPIVIKMSAAPQGSSITLNVASSDADGYIRTTTVDWGAGAAATDLGGDTDACDDSGGRYWPDSWTRSTATSPVLATGTYTVTVTVTSTGCDGKDSQSATEQVTVVVP